MHRPDQIYPSGYKPYPEGTEGTRFQYQQLTHELKEALYNLEYKRIEIMVAIAVNIASPLFWDLDKVPEVSLVELGGRGIWLAGILGGIYCIPALLKSARKIKPIRESINQLDLNI